MPWSASSFNSVINTVISNGSQIWEIEAKRGGKPPLAVMKGPWQIKVVSFGLCKHLAPTEGHCRSLRHSMLLSLVLSLDNRMIQLKSLHKTWCLQIICNWLTAVNLKLICSCFPNKRVRNSDWKTKWNWESAEVFLFRDAEMWSVFYESTPTTRDLFLDLPKLENECHSGLSGSIPVGSRTH